MSTRYLLLSIVSAMLLTAATGCPTRREAPPIPPQAVFGTEGAGRLAYTAAHDGTMQVYDMSRNELVFAAQVEQGQSIVVDPQADRITIDGRRLLEGRLSRGNRHAIYLLPAPPDDRVQPRRTEDDRDRLPPPRGREPVREPRR